MIGIRVLAVASEIYPLVKTGGLADVAGALPRALLPYGVSAVTLVPGYRAVMAALRQSEKVLAFDDLFGGAAQVLRARAGGLDLFVIHAPHLFDRSGTPYAAEDGREWADNALRFAALGWVAARIGLGDVAGFIPDVVHAHDWQAGLAMAYLAYAGARRPATVMTVHNLAFQGQFPADLLARLRLPPQSYTIDGVEHYGAIGFLKAGLQLADRITTVSPTYAQEIQTAPAGCGLEGLLRWRSAVLSGIRNGIDTDVWNPQTDALIPSRFGLSSVALRGPNKTELQRRFDLTPEPTRLLFGMVSRLTWQKGIDILGDAVPALIALGAQLVVLGTGDWEYQNRIRGLASAYRNQVGCVIGYDEGLAHLMQAGADALLVPSRFEPSGLTQMCAMRYGAIPVVSKVGGLADTVVDPADAASRHMLPTGLQFFPTTTERLAEALRRTADLWGEQTAWRSVQANALTTDVSWAEPARAYCDLYAGLPRRR
jgi:starch synthase